MKHARDRLYSAVCVMTRFLSPLVLLHSKRIALHPRLVAFFPPSSAFARPHLDQPNRVLAAELSVVHARKVPGVLTL